MQDSSRRPCAVVVGLCAHGLTIARALHNAGIQVIALEADEGLPGVHTRCADVRIVRDINHAGLIDALLHLSSRSEASGRPVLFLTNDRMVETVGMHARSIAEHYRLSWATSSDAILPLLRKDCIESRCRETGLRYPKTCVVSRLDELVEQAAPLTFPVIIKPTRPISAFKTLVIQSPAELNDAKATVAASMPVVVQEFVPGSDKSIRFGALYLRDGEILARFEGRKLRSRPMGHTTIAVSEPNEEIHELAAKFFAGLNISGPVSLELKRAPDATQWVIEPTVGRTDFWVGLCVANQVDLPVLEYKSALGDQFRAPTQNERYVWINGERDPGALAWLLSNEPATLLTKRVRGVYASAGDSGPLTVAVRKYLVELPGRAVRKAKKLVFAS